MPTTASDKAEQAGRQRGICVSSYLPRLVSSRRARRARPSGSSESSGRRPMSSRSSRSSARAARSADSYLTVSEIFPMETRALAIAFVYAGGTAVGGITGPFLFGKMIESGEESQVAIAFFIGAAVMAVGGIVELFFGVKAEQVALEDIAKPLTAEDAEPDGGRERDEAAAAPSAQRPERDVAAEAAMRERRRRYRLGPGRTSWSPGMLVSAPTAEVEFEREVSAIERALADRGPTERRELSRLVGARYWGPGRFSAALREAVESGRARRVSRNHFGPAG